MSLSKELAHWQWAIREIREELDYWMSSGTYSAGFAVELAHHRVERIYDTNKILDEIGYLEGTNKRQTMTPPPEPFKGPILTGFWKKQHYQDAFLVRNLLNETLRKSSPLSKLLHRPQEHSVSTLEHISHEAVVGQFSQRAQQRRMSGEYIIFERTKSGANHYLTLGLHNEDQLIRERIDIYREIDQNVG